MSSVRSKVLPPTVTMAGCPKSSYLPLTVFELTNVKFAKAAVEYWMDNWTVSDVTGHAGVIGQYLANAIISDKSK